MKPLSDAIRQAFHEPLRLPVKITPEGFLLEDTILPELRGKLTRVALTRKLFDDGALVCCSSDGLYGTDAKICNLCVEPSCHPRLRVQLAARDAVYLLELAASSARNLLAIEDEVSRRGTHLAAVTLRLTVLPRGHWGEVRFEIIADPANPS
jgi:hypothetical protein